MTTSAGGVKVETLIPSRYSDSFHVQERNQRERDDYEQRWQAAYEAGDDYQRKWGKGVRVPEG